MIKVSPEDVEKGVLKILGEKDGGPLHPNQFEPQFDIWDASDALKRLASKGLVIEAPSSEPEENTFPEYSLPKQSLG